MDKSDLVSVLIPVYNRESLVGKAIESAVNQTYSNIEVIIVDNNSSDNTWEVLKGYSQIDERIKIFRNDKNLGPVGNWFECLKRSNGKYIKFLFSDDWLDTDFIDKSIQFLIENKDIGFVYSKVSLQQHGDSKIIYKNYDESKVISSNTFVYRYVRVKGNVPVSPCCAIFRKQDVEKSLLYYIPNPLDIDYPKTGGGNDVLIFLLTAARYKKVAYLDTSTCHFFGGSDSITRNEDLLVSYLYAITFFLNSYKKFTRFYKLLIGIRFMGYLMKNLERVTIINVKVMYYLIR